MDHFAKVQELVSLNPVHPVFCLRPHSAKLAASRLVRRFPGKVLYAVKANTNPVLLNALYQGGIRHFDVTSPAELEKLKPLKDVRCYNMNPVKHAQNIRGSHQQYGVRAFAVDSIAELRKIQHATGYSRGLDLFVRVAVDSTSSQIPLNNKFGAKSDEAPLLLRAARSVANRLGLSFHVGSQCLAPPAYAMAIEKCNKLVQKTGVEVDYLDVGGGFPAPYPGTNAPPLETYVHTIRQACMDGAHSRRCRLMCEPGRILVAESCSILVSITLRKDQHLYITDGAYGALYDAAHLGVRYPVKLHRAKAAETSEKLLPFDFFGPTCDSLDHMPGPFLLPADCREGDYIEIGMCGAYAQELVTGFNGFSDYGEVVIDEFVSPLRKTRCTVTPINTHSDTPAARESNPINHEKIVTSD